MRVWPVAKITFLEALRRIWLVAKITFLEALRRKDFYALLILLGLYALVANVLLSEKPDDPSVARLLFSLGLTSGFASAAILVVVLAARQVPAEIEQGTVLPLLSRPVSRWQFLFAKFLACWLVGVGSLLCFVILIRLVVPAPGQVGGLLFLQAVALKTAALAALAALTLLLSLFLPSSFNVTLSLGYYFFWGIAFGVLHAGFAAVGGRSDRVIGRLLYILPHFEVLNISRVCMMQSSPIDWGLALVLLMYGFGYAAIALLAAWNIFERRWV